MSPRDDRASQNPVERPSPASWLLVAIAWTLVGLPLGWGIYITLEKALVLFR
ncbi:MAG: MFS transporter small subunit [bacterium]